jgi:hypothetical protein
MKKWEYKVITWEDYINTNVEVDVSVLLNEHGQNGWELVSIVPQIDSSSNEQKQVDSVGTISNILVFKRPVICNFDTEGNNDKDNGIGLKPSVGKLNR